MQNFRGSKKSIMVNLKMAHVTKIVFYLVSANGNGTAVNNRLVKMTIVLKTSPTFVK